MKILQFWGTLLTTDFPCYIRHYITFQGEKGSLGNIFFRKISPDLSCTMQKEWENAFGGETFGLLARYVVNVGHPIGAYSAHCHDHELLATIFARGHDFM